MIEQTATRLTEKDRARIQRWSAIQGLQNGPIGEFDSRWDDAQVRLEELGLPRLTSREVDDAQQWCQLQSMKKDTNGDNLSLMYKGFNRLAELFSKRV